MVASIRTQRADGSESFMELKSSKNDPGTANIIDKIKSGS